MLRSKRWARLGLLLLGVIVVLTGCFGGGLTPKPTPASINGQIYGPAGVQVASGTAMNAPAILAAADRPTVLNLFGTRAQAATAPQLAGESTVANATVLVYILADYLNNPNVAPVAQAKTDANGKYTVSGFPAGKDLLIVTASTPRLSAILPKANRDTPGNINSTTSLATEAWVETLGLDASITIDSASLRETIDAAQSALRSLDAAELLAALTALVPNRLGDGWPSDLPRQWQSIANAVTGTMPAGPLICRLKLFESVGTPASFLTLAGISPSWSDNDTFARFEVEDHDQPIPVYIELTGGDEAEFVMPLHPHDPMQGGPGHLVVYNEALGVECPPLPITVQPLSPAPSDMGLAGLFDALEQSFTGYAEALGYTTSDLLNMDVTQPANLANGFVTGLAAGLQMLTGDGVTHNMRDALNGSITVAGETYTFTPDDLMLVEAMAYTSGYSESLLTMLDEFSRLPAPPTTSAAGGMGVMAMQPLQGGIPPLPQNIATPAELDYWMDVRTYCTMWDNAWLRAPREIIGGMASAASVLPGTQVVTGPVLAHLTISQMAVDICSNLLPHKLTAFHVEASPGAHNEDSDTEGTWQAQLTAAGEDWTLDWPTIIGAIPGVGSAGKVITKVAKQFGETWRRAEPLTAWMQGLLFDVWGIHSSSGPVTLPPLDPLPIIIDPTRSADREYIEWELVTLDGDQPFVFNPDETGYVAQNIGTSQLWVRTRPGAFQGEFAGGHAILQVKPIEVEVIQPGWPASPYYVDAGEEIGLAAVVSNADDSTVEWTATGGHIVREPGSLGEQLIRYTAPLDPGSYIVTAESMTRTGLRQSGQPPRTGFAEIIVGGLRLMPSSTCVEIGEAVPLSVVYSFGGEANFSDLAVSVSGNAGYVEGNVFYAVRKGSVTITVWDPDFPQWSDEAVFTVNEECDGFSVTAVGYETFSFDGMCMIHSEGDMHFKDNVGNTVYIRLPYTVLRDLEDGQEFAVLDSVGAEIQNLGSNTRHGAWVTGFGYPSTLTVWGEYAERDIYVEVIDETLTEEFFFLSGELTGTFWGEKVLVDENGNQKIEIVETDVVIEFRRVTDGWASDGGYWEEVVCEDAEPGIWW